MKFTKPYRDVLEAMSKGNIYYIPCMNKCLIKLSERKHMHLNLKMLQFFHDQGFIRFLGKDDLAYRYELNDRGREALKEISKEGASK